MQVFVHKPKYWANLIFDLMMALDEKVEDHQSDYSSSWGERQCLNRI